MMFVLDAVSKAYGSTVALHPLSLAVARGETLAVVGPSGAGKTTLLHLLGGVTQPSAGAVWIAGRPLASLPPGRELARLVGVMHQQLDLVPHLAAVHNVLAGRLGEWRLLRSLVSLVAPRELHRALAALERVGIPEKLYERTARLSGGEQQRVALARLLVQDPAAIVADEPVASLDPARAEDLLQLLTGIARDDGKTLVASLHSIQLARRYFARIVGLRRGRLAFDLPAAAVSQSHVDRLYNLDERADDLATAAAR
ncbi:MAG: ATP-binding cassette domain-containing protein [Chloroflexi bacterium]|nr:ATP-binding cassette domain-containing protein [Chloroflexota bacterium]